MEWIVGIAAILTAAFSFLTALFISPDMIQGDYRPRAAVNWMGSEKGRSFILVVGAGILLAAGGMFQTSILATAILGGLAMVCLTVFLIRIRPEERIAFTPKLKRRLYAAIVLIFGVGAVCILSGWMLAVAGAAIVSPFYPPVVCGLFDLFGQKERK